MTKVRFGITLVLAAALGVFAAMIVAPSLSHQETHGADAIHATWAEKYLSLSAMAQNVDAVVLAVVQNTRAGRQIVTGSGSTLPFTLVDLRVSRSIRGVLSEDEVFTLEQTGGDIGDRSLSIHQDGGAYTPGDQVLLFVKQQPETGYFYLVNPQGRFGVRGGRLMAANPEDAVSMRLDLLDVNDGMNLIRREAGPGR